MNFDVNPLLAKFRDLDGPPLVLSGYIGSVDKQIIELHEQLDASSYIKIPKDMILHSEIIGNEPTSRRLFYIAPSAKICVVRVKCVDARDYKNGNSCGCKDAEIPPPPNQRTADAWITYARLLMSLGIFELDCRSYSGWGSGCCQYLNRLIRDLRAGGTGEGDAMILAAVCSATNN